MKNIVVFVVVMSLFASCMSDTLKESEKYGNPIVNYFVIDNSKDTVLKGIEGTILKIPAFCFIDSSGNIANNSIKVALNEVFTKEAMIANHTVTQDVEGNVLESSGMIKIEIYNKEQQKLTLAPDKQIEVQFPKTKTLIDSKLYKGKAKNGIVFWEETKSDADESEWFEIVERIVQRPAMYAHLGDSITVQYFKLQIDGKDTLKIKLAENEIPEWLRKRKLYSAFLSVSAPFYIKETGWYNVDKLLIEDTDNQFSNVRIRVKNIPANPNEVDLKLVFKTRNILLSGFFDEQQNCYAFGYEQDGKILLPQKEKAFIIAMCYHGQDIYFASKEIETDLSMKYNISLEKTSLEDLKKRMREMFPNLGNSN